MSIIGYRGQTHPSIVWITLYPMIFGLPALDFIGSGQVLCRLSFGGQLRNNRGKTPKPLIRQAILILPSNPVNRTQIANAHVITEFQSQGKLTRDTTEQGKMRWYSLPRTLFPVGKIYWWEQLPRREGVTPYVIHNNWVVGLYIKEYRFREAGLWFLAQPPDYYAREYL